MANKNRLESSINKCKSTHEQSKNDKSEIRIRRQKRLNAAAHKAQGIWKKATAIPEDHPDLHLNKANQVNAKLYKEMIIFPIKDFNNQLAGLAYFGQKGMITTPDTRIDGSYIPISKNIADFNKVIICDSLDYGCQLLKQHPTALVLSSITSSNFIRVASLVREKHKNLPIVIATDYSGENSIDDIFFANKAALAVNASVLTPNHRQYTPKPIKRQSLATGGDE